MIKEKIRTYLNLDITAPIFLNDVIRYLQNNNLAYCMTDGLFNSFVFVNQNGTQVNWNLKKSTLEEQDSKVLDKLNSLIEPIDKKKHKISSKVFKDIASLDDLIFKIVENNSEHESVEEFKIRFEQFKIHLKDILPDFFIFDILKIEDKLQDFNKIYSFSGHQDFLAAIEFELKNN